jgi:hypothetical protein
MSKKLIAVAAAAALALTGLVATPAGASTITVVAITTTGTTLSTTDVASHTSSTSAVTAATAMTSRSLDFALATGETPSVTTGTTTRNVVRFDVTTASGTTVTVTSAGGVEVTDALVDADAKSYTIDRNLTTLSKVTATGALTYTFYAYSTSTTAGSVVIETPSTKRTYYVKGLAGEAYNITNAKWPTSIVSGQANDDDNTNLVTWNTTDVFGNSLESAQGVLTAFGATTPSATAAVWKTTAKVNEAKIHGTASSSISLSLNITPRSLVSAGWPAPVKSLFVTVSAASAADQVVTLTAQVAALTASVAALKADYNSVAKKYNKLVKKSKRVALK